MTLFARIALTLILLFLAIVRREPANAVEPQTLTNSLGMKLAAVPSGTFSMGPLVKSLPRSQRSQYARMPRHEVRITRPFYLGVCEVTQAEYEQVMGQNPSSFSTKGEDKAKVAGQDTGRFPVENVSWEEAQQFCRKLSQKEGATYRLPTEAEWEYACRGGGPRPSYFLYAWGDGISLAEANYNGRGSRNVLVDPGTSLNRPTAVASYRPNGLGLYDMHGNVDEWCADWYSADYYEHTPVDDPKGPATGSIRVYRGGSWLTPADFCRSFDRACVDPTFKHHSLGFRVVCEMAATAVAASATPAHVAPKPDVPKPVEPSPAKPKAGEAKVAASKVPSSQPPVEPKGTAFTTKGGMVLALVPAGTFLMGSPENEKSRLPSEHQHRVRITRPFYMGIYEVTQSEYSQVMQSNPSFIQARRRKKNEDALDTTRYPVENVSWDDARQFCARLSQTEGKTFRLPTEAEWEYACRGGATTAFAWGESASSSQANFNGGFAYAGAANGPNLSRSTTVGSYQPNGFGLHDMHGNVWEWCSDWYSGDYFTKSPEDDPPGPELGTARVIRGGSWFNSGSYCRAADRGSSLPAQRSAILGFRVVCER